MIRLPQTWTRVPGRLARGLAVAAATLVSACAPPSTPLRIGNNVWPGYEPAHLSRALGYEQLSPAGRGAPSGPALADAVRDAVFDLNIAGLCDPAKRNWYPADAADTIRDAPKLGVTGCGLKKFRLTKLVWRGAT